MISDEEERVVRYKYVFTDAFLKLLQNDGKLTNEMGRIDKGAALLGMLSESLLHYNKKEKIYRNELRLALAGLLIESMKECSMVFGISDKDKAE